MASGISAQVWTAAGMFLLLTVGTWLGYTGASRQSARDLEVLERTIAGHLRLAERQQELRYQAEHAQRARERMEEAYNVLARWLRELSRTIDEAWAGSVTGREEDAAKSAMTLDRWPWETLRIPVDIAWAELYWSSEVRTLLHKFDSASARFVLKGKTALRARSTMDETEGQDAGAEFFVERGKLKSVLSEVRDQARLDLQRAGRINGP
ncbi:hypothetical protein [Streptomyces sp. NPDC046805]|uniref:hypothetical protein n=1 Tax=Streptomyces sp. NPDC046805 TaxID=3155134 RepID=UPI0033CB4CBE